MARNTKEDGYVFLFEITFTRQQHLHNFKLFKDHIIPILFLRIELYTKIDQNKLIY